MKEFNLDAALNGEPVVLRSGRKAYIGHKTPDCYVCDSGEKIEFPLHGYIIKADNIIEVPNMFWNINGRAYKDGVDNASDIVGMWEDPKISIEDLPKPFRPEISEEFFYLSAGSVKYCSFYSDINAELMRSGQCFRTKQDVQKWLDFMKSMME